MRNTNHGCRSRRSWAHGAGANGIRDFAPLPLWRSPNAARAAARGPRGRAHTTAVPVPDHSSVHRRCSPTHHADARPAACGSDDAPPGLRDDRAAPPACSSRAPLRVPASNATAARPSAGTPPPARVAAPAMARRPRSAVAHNATRSARSPSSDRSSARSTNWGPDCLAQFGGNGGGTLRGECDRLSIRGSVAPKTPRQIHGRPPQRIRT